MLREIWEGTNKQLSFTRIALTPCVLSCCFGIIWGIIKAEPLTIASSVAGITGMLFAKSQQSKYEESAPVYEESSTSEVPKDVIQQ